MITEYSPLPDTIIADVVGGSFSQPIPVEEKLLGVEI